MGEWWNDLFSTAILNIYPYILHLLIDILSFLNNFTQVSHVRHHEQFFSPESVFHFLHYLSNAMFCVKREPVQFRLEPLGVLQTVWSNNPLKKAVNNLIKENMPRIYEKEKAPTTDQFLETKIC